MHAVERFLGLEPYEGYPSLGNPIHVTDKRSIPEHIVDEIRAFSEEQYEFLQERFGKQLLQDIR